MTGGATITALLSWVGTSVFLAASIVSAQQQRPVTFLDDVRPILESSCLRCHGEAKSSGGLQMHSKEAFLKGGKSGPVAVAGDAKHSLLIERVFLPADDEEMMPRKGDRLTPQQIEVLTLWIDRGLHWPDGIGLMERSSQAYGTNAPTGNGHIRYLTGRKLQPSSSAQLDALIKEDNASRKGIVPGPLIDDLAFLRKVTVDLIGRIPTHDEIADYLALPAQTRRREIVEKLLVHPRFADRWTAYFSDLLQIRTTAPGGKQLVAYIRRCIANGTPYDEMARELISSSGSPKTTPAVGYIMARNADPMELAGTSSQSFLGVQLSCAQCHDHPFDKWSQKQFYEFAGWFGKAKRVVDELGNPLYVTETDRMSVRWPPEGKSSERSRKPVKPVFPFPTENPDELMARFEASRQQQLVRSEKRAADKSFQDEIETIASRDLRASKSPRSPLAPDEDLEAAAKAQSEKWRQPGPTRLTLAEQITHPGNRYFSRAAVNRIWSELMGRGFFEPVDDFRDDTIISHPRAIEYLADEFVASGFDWRSLLRLIVFSDAYQRGHLIASAPDMVRRDSVDAFVASRWRRMNAEALFDSIVEAGHLANYKWPEGENIKQIEQRIAYQVPVPGNTNASSATASAPAPIPVVTSSPYDLEDAVSLNVAAVAKRTTSSAGDSTMKLINELDPMKTMTDAAASKQPAPTPTTPVRPRTRTAYRMVKTTIDDNPRYGSAYHVSSPASPAHFLRVFGQPSRERLSEYRDETPSLRQQLMMINGRLTHEASRVGPLEPIYPLLAGAKPQLETAIHRAYLESLSRKPTPDELSEALSVVREAPNVLEGMADLRWVLLNCDEFRYLP
jgi:hypothetical protein